MFGGQLRKNDDLEIIRRKCQRCSSLTLKLFLDIIGNYIIINGSYNFQRCYLFGYFCISSIGVVAINFSKIKMNTGKNKQEINALFTSENYKRVTYSKWTSIKELFLQLIPKEEINKWYYYIIPNENSKEKKDIKGKMAFYNDVKGKGYIFLFKFFIHATDTLDFIISFIKKIDENYLDERLIRRCDEKNKDIIITKFCNMYSETLNKDAFEQIIMEMQFKNDKNTKQLKENPNNRELFINSFTELLDGKNIKDIIEELKKQKREQRADINLVNDGSGCELIENTGKFDLFRESSDEDFNADESGDEDFSMYKFY